MDRPTTQLRVRVAGAAPVRRDGDHVLYWMIASRRPRWSFALDRAVDQAAELRKPLIVLEPLRCDYPWASDRLHRFVLQGMADHRAAFADAPVLYHPYVEPRPGAGKGLLAALAERACVVVTDDWPCSFLPRMVAAAAERLPVRLEAVDANGLLPLRAADRTFSTAHSFRTFLQRELEPHLRHLPRPDPFARRDLPTLDALPDAVLERWPAATDALLEAAPPALAALPIDHAVPPAPARGGPVAAERALAIFLAQRLDRYADERNHPDADAASGLSPWLHFGHLSIHQVLHALAEREGWSPADLEGSAGGKRTGWWRMSPAAESFLDEAVTWRELGHNFCSREPDYDRYESLPDWARKTLEEHAADPRDPVYDLPTLERAETHDELWNAAQTQLLVEGRMHNYLRMLWGKKILEWTASPRDAIEAMIELNNKHALDGRDPNSYSGIFWCLGRYDRAWGPERPIYGKVRYMTSDSTRRKLRLSQYIERWGKRAHAGLFDA